MTSSEPSTLRSNYSQKLENFFCGGLQPFSSYNHTAELIKNQTQNSIVLIVKITQTHQTSNVKIRAKMEPDIWDGASGSVEPKLRLLKPLSLPFQ